MSELKVAITIVEVIVTALVVLLLGDFLGYKLGRKKLAAIAGIILLISIVGFVICAAIVLL